MTRGERRHEPTKAATNSTLTVIAALIGGVRGFQRAGALGGTRLDKAQYVVGYAIAFGLAGTFAGVCIARLFEL
jgi:uncharacterized protein YcfJ